MYFEVCNHVNFSKNNILDTYISVTINNIYKEIQLQSIIDISNTGLENPITKMGDTQSIPIKRDI